MFRLIFHLVAHLHSWLQAYAPTNRLIARLRTRRGLKWGLPAMVIGVAYWYAAAICDVIIDRGGPGWLNLLIALFMWNGIKFLVIGPINLIDVAYARWTEWRQRRGKPARIRRSQPRYEPTYELEYFGTSEQPCSGRDDHVPGSNCPVDGRCLAAWGAIQSSKRSAEPDRY